MCAGILDLPFSTIKWIVDATVINGNFRQKIQVRSLYKMNVLAANFYRRPIAAKLIVPEFPR